MDKKIKNVPEGQGKSALLTSLRSQKKELQQVRFRRAVRGRQHGEHKVLRRRSARTTTALALEKKQSSSSS